MITLRLAAISIASAILVGLTGGLSLLGSEVRTLTPSEVAELRGGRLEKECCTDKPECQEPIQVACSQIDDAQQCTQSFVDHKVEDNNDEVCVFDPSGGDCTMGSTQVVCLRTFHCDWDANTQTCFEDEQVGDVKAPVTCEDECSS